MALGFICWVFMALGFICLEKSYHGHRLVQQVLNTITTAGVPWRNVSTILNSSNFKLLSFLCWAPMPFAILNARMPQSILRKTRCFPPSLEHSFHRFLWENMPALRPSRACTHLGCMAAGHEEQVALPRVSLWCRIVGGKGEEGETSSGSLRHLTIAFLDRLGAESRSARVHHSSSSFRFPTFDYERNTGDSRKTCAFCSRTRELRRDTSLHTPPRNRRWIRPQTSFKSHWNRWSWTVQTKGGHWVRLDRVKMQDEQ